MLLGNSYAVGQGGAGTFQVTLVGTRESQIDTVAFKRGFEHKSGHNVAKYARSTLPTPTPNPGQLPVPDSGLGLANFCEMTGERTHASRAGEKSTGVPRS